jgi:hemolysin activation/secretion protein
VPQKLKTPTLFLCFLLINIAYFDKSDASDNLLKQQTQIIQNQQQINNQQKRKREFERIKKQRDQLEQNIKDSPSSSSPPQTTKASSQAPNCFIVKKIALIDANSLSNRQKQQIKSSFLGKCFDGSTLENLTNQLNSLYQEIGLTTTQITIPQQNISTGNLKLKIIEGKIADIIFDDDKITDKMQKFTAFGLKKGKILNIGDINQGIYQINRLSSNNAKMRIEPGSQEGTSKIIINNNDKKKLPISTKVSYDNLGNNFTGIKRTNISSTIDNLFFLNDQINLSYNQNLDDPSNKKDLRSFSGSISIPFTYNLLSYSHSTTKFRGQNASQEDQPKILTGNSSSNNISIDRTLLNSSKYTISTNLSLTAKKTASYLNKQKPEGSERKLTIGSLSFAISRYFKNGATVYLKPQYNAGLKLLNAKQDEQWLTDDIPKAQFQTFKLYGSISKRFQIPKINAPITLSTQIDSQISKDTLFGSEQFSIGGYYSVRGFRENNIY